MKYTIEKVCTERLTKEISESEITIALAGMTHENAELNVFFKCDLSAGEQTILDAIIANHSGIRDNQSKMMDVKIVEGHNEVTTQMEKNDKTLRMAGGFAQTDADGVARVVFKIPTNGRKAAYGDAEFENRIFGDMITKVEIQDRARLIAWAVALAIDPEATEPVSDATIQAMGVIEGYGSFPLYPICDHYDEKAVIADANTEGQVFGGCVMTFKYGNTEIQPVGGYGNLPGDFYLVVEAKNVLSARTAGDRLQVSIDWGEPDA